MRRFLTVVAATGVFFGSFFLAQAASTFLVQQGGTGVGTFTSGQIIYGNGTGALSSVATTTASCSGSSSCSSFTVIGSSPVTISSSGVGSGLATTSPVSSSNVLTYSSAGAGSAYGTATTSHSFSGPFSITGTIGALVGGINSIITWSGLATTSQPASSNILVSNGTAGVYGVATSSLSATGPITFSGTLGSQVGGAAGSFGCTTAASGVAGCLSNTSFDTFNNKQATISTTWPITLSGATVGFNGLSTSTAAVIGNIPYFSGVNTFANVATTTLVAGTNISFGGATPIIIGASPITISASGGGGSGTVSTSTNETSGTLPYWTSNSATPALLGKVSTTTQTFSGPFSITGTLGALVGGANSTVTWNGLATTSQPTLSQLLYSTGGAGVAGTATTTASCSGSTSCTSFTVLGSSPVTISSSAVGTGLATTSPVSSSNLLVYSSAGAGAAYGVATTSLTASGVLSLSQPISVIGPSASALSITGGSTNTVLTTNGVDVVAWGKLNLANQVQSTLAYGNGGTGTTTAPQGQLLYGGATAYQSVATTTFTPSAEFTIGGTLGALVGGANSTLTLATNGVALTKIAQIAANTILGNNTGATANVTAFATSTLGIALSDTTGTLLVGRGGTGLSSVADGSLLFGSGGTALTALASSTGGFLTNAYATGRPSWAATSTLNVALGDTTGTLASNRGGTGQSSYTTGDVLYASNSSTLTKLGVGTAGQVLGVVAGIPAWVATSTSGGGSGTVGSGTQGQFPFYNANGTTLTATSSLFISQSGNIGIASTSPSVPLSVVGSSFLAGTTTIGIGANGYLQVGSAAPIYGYLPNDRFNIRDNRNDYSAGNIENDSSAACATADFTETNDLSSNAAFFNDQGHTSSGFTGVGCANNPFPDFGYSSSYSFDPSGNYTFAIATTSATGHFGWDLGGYAISNRKLTLTSTGLGIGSTTPTATLAIDSTTTTPTQPLLRVAAMGATVLNLATTTPTALQSGDVKGFGIGTSSPDATFSLIAASSTANAAPIFDIYGIINAITYIFWRIDSWGHELMSGPAPVCDANCTYVAGNDNAFRVQLGSSITSSTVTFSHAWGTLAPICVANEGSAGTVDVSASSTPSTVVLTALSALTSKDVEVICRGIQ